MCMQPGTACPHAVQGPLAVECCYYFRHKLPARGAFDAGAGHVDLPCLTQPPSHLWPNSGPWYAHLEKPAPAPYSIKDRSRLYTIAAERRISGFYHGLVSWHRPRSHALVPEWLRVRLQLQHCESPPARVPRHFIVSLNIHCFLHGNVARCELRIGAACGGLNIVSHLCGD
ncbi:hypothetical protein IQ07DRAFT_3620 [Pyrenochaeta sp. DS3sAY3a]|nr:hypothetical protein IQ07DRAFT_3620 [Pyrenochaeta sp. DS3sAY3a]